MITALVLFTVACGFYAGGALVSVLYAVTASVEDNNPTWARWGFWEKVLALTIVVVAWPFLWFTRYVVTVRKV